jgi:hypothetical protein
MHHHACKSSSKNALTERSLFELAKIQRQYQVLQRQSVAKPTCLVPGVAAKAAQKPWLGSIQ